MFWRHENGCFYAIFVIYPYRLTEYHEMTLVFYFIEYTSWMMVKLFLPVAFAISVEGVCLIQ